MKTVDQLIFESPAFELHEYASKLMHENSRFVFPPPLEGENLLAEIDRHKSARAQLQTAQWRRSPQGQPKSPPEAIYFIALMRPSGPVLEAQDVLRRMRHARPRLKAFGFARNLEAMARDLAFSAYRFEKSLKHYGECAKKLLPNTRDERTFSAEIGKLIKNFHSKNTRLMRFRGYLAHGTDREGDEFSELNSWEMYGRLEDHEALNFRTYWFLKYKKDWREIARDARDFMEQAVIHLLAIDRELHASGKLRLWTAKVREK